MKILITGATGLVGKELGKKLVSNGHELVVLARSSERAQLELPFPAQIFRWDGVNDIPEDAALVGVEAVIHLAGESIAGGRWTDKRKQKIYDSRILGTRNLRLAISRAPSVKTLISASAIGIYGDSGSKVLDEDSSQGQDFLAQVCKDWEHETKGFGNQVRVVNLRIGVVLSRHGGALEKLIPLFSAGLGGAIGSGKQWMSWIHVEDLVNICEFALTHENVKGPHHAVAPSPVTNQHFSRVLAKSLGRWLFFPVPTLVMKMAMGEMSTIVVSSQKVSSQKIQSSGFSFTYPTIEAAMLEVCGPLRNGQRELLAEQWVPRRPEEIFPFFCDEKNLEKLTPEFLNFKVLKKSTTNIETGTFIDYRLKLHGIPLRWRSKIEQWKPDVEFVDLQTTGPYKRWHHTHEFLPLASGTLIRDRVSYILPLGRLGDLLVSWKVVNDVKQIFKYRREVIRGLFA